MILFGLSMDYHVFIISRIREAVDGGMKTDDAVAHGIKATAGVVTSAAVVMVAVFAIFASLSMIEFKQMGVGLAVAILLDATLVRAVLLPATMKLLGERNWYLPRAAALVAEVGTRDGTGRRKRMPSIGLMRIGVLTGGGDCPGLNAVIRAIVRKGINAHGHEFFGFRYGWAGVLKNEGTELNLESTRGILHRGGTILGSSRTNVYKVEDGLNKVKAAMEAQGLDALIPIGGEDTLGVAGQAARGRHPGRRRAEDDRQRPGGHGLHVRLPDRRADRHRRDRPAAHHRGVPQPRAGRARSWAATPAGSPCYSGIAGGADVILIPERPFDIDEVCDHLKRRHATGTTFSIVVVAEGATPKDGGLLTQHQTTDSFGHVRLGGIGDRAREGDRGEDGLRVAHDDPRPHPARRHAARVRPRARHAASA